MRRDECAYAYAHAYAATVLITSDKSLGYDTIQHDTTIITQILLDSRMTLLQNSSLYHFFDCCSSRNGHGHGHSLVICKNNRLAMTVAK